MKKLTVLILTYSLECVECSLSSPCFILPFLCISYHACMFYIGNYCLQSWSFLWNLRPEMERASDKEKHIEVSITIGVKRFRFWSTIRFYDRRVPEVVTNFGLMCFGEEGGVMSQTLQMVYKLHGFSFDAWNQIMKHQLGWLHSSL